MANQIRLQPNIMKSLLGSFEMALCIPTEETGLKKSKSLGLEFVMKMNTQKRRFPRAKLGGQRSSVPEIIPTNQTKKKTVVLCFIFCHRSVRNSRYATDKQTHNGREWM